MKTTIATSDEALIAQYNAGCAECMSVLYERYAQKVFYKCLSFVKDEELAYDLAQDALLKAFDKAKAFNGDSAFSTWLYAVVYNHCIDYVRAQQRARLKAARMANTDTYEEPDWERELELQRQQLALDALLAELSEADRNMLLAKYRDNASIQDLMITFNLGASAVKMRLKRAKEKIRVLYTGLSNDTPEFAFL